MTEAEEAACILRLYRNDEIKAFELIRSQCNAMAQRGGLLLTLSGVSMTIFCISGKYFSGHIGLPQIGMVTGELLILLSAFWVFVKVMRIRWVSSYLTDDPLAMLQAGIRERNLRRCYYFQAGILFLTGAAVYLSSIFYLFLSSGAGTAIAPAPF